MIPKIIFQTAPENKELWKPSWFECVESWKKFFLEKEYTYFLWDDYQNQEFIKNEYPMYYDMYMSYETNIKRVDMIRYFFLHKYGGIYADMDYMAMKNFYGLLHVSKVSICESPFKEWEEVQNSLMTSYRGNIFWIKVIEKAKERIYEKDVLKSTGPILLTDVYMENKKMVNILPVNQFNPKSGTEEFNSENVMARHYGTCSWNYPEIKSFNMDKRVKEISSIYEELLERSPDDKGLKFYYYSGKTGTGIRNDIKRSKEFRDKKYKL